jgi:hypothetical protein
MRKQQYSISSKLLLVLLIFLALPITIFLVQHTQRVQDTASSLRYTIYEDALASEWKARSWASRINLANTSPAYSGSRSISFTPERKGARLNLYANTAVDTTLYSFLHFAAQANHGGQDYNVLLYGGTNNPLSKVRLASHGGDPVPGTWKVYDIPLSDLRAKATVIRGVAFECRSFRHGTLYLDSISLTGLVAKATSTPAPTSTHASTPTPTVAGGGHTYWTADYESGDLSQWASIHTGSAWGSNSSITVVTSPAPVRQGTYSAKFVVASGDRAEATATQANTGGYANQDWYYSWSTYIPSVPNAANGWSTAWNSIIQWMDLLARCSPPVSVKILAGTPPHFYLQSDPRDNTNGCSRLGPYQAFDMGPIRYDQWYDFTFHIKFSANPAVGYVEGWLNGNQVVPLTHMRTLDTSGGVYLEQQLYRGPTNFTNVLYHDWLRRTDYYPGTTQARGTPMPTPPASACPTLHVGSTGVDVSHLQALLDSNQANLVIDGKFGPVTEAAVKAFQASKGLSATGIVDPATWTALGVHCNASNSPGG